MSRVNVAKVEIDFDVCAAVLLTVGYICCWYTEFSILTCLHKT